MATLAIVVTVLSASINTGVFFLTAVATSTSTERADVPPAEPAVRSLPIHLTNENHLATSSDLSNSLTAIAPPETTSTTATSQNNTLPLVIALPARMYRAHGCKEIDLTERRARGT